MSLFQQPGKDVLAGLVLPFQDTVLPSAARHQQCLSAAGRYLCKAISGTEGLVCWRKSGSVGAAENGAMQGKMRCTKRLFPAPKYSILL